MKPQELLKNLFTRKKKQKTKEKNGNSNRRANTDTGFNHAELKEERCSFLKGTRTN
jgi:hypothetical protein